MRWGEALRLVRLLRKDTTSQFAASMEGWDFPVDRGTLATLDVYDLTVAANSDPKKGRLDPHPGRPYKLTDPRKREKYGDTAGRSNAEVISILKKLGHNLPA